MTRGNMPMIVNCIKTAIPIRQFYGSQLNIEHFKSSGWNDGGLCPFHSDNKAGSFRVNVEHGAFKCYSCGAQGGDVIDFLRLLNGWGFQQAVVYLDGSEICQPSRKNLVQPPPDREQNRLKLSQQWEKSIPAQANHPYLVKKRIANYGTRQLSCNLVIPLFDGECLIRGIQNIAENGSKWFSAGSSIQGNYFLVGKETSTALIICEGYSTGSTLHEQTGHQVAIAFNAGNLEPVAVALRKNHPKIDIIIAADNDRYHKDGTPRTDNPGLNAATKAAKRINAKLAVPEFPDGVLGSDFNDLANLGVLS